MEMRAMISAALVAAVLATPTGYAFAADNASGTVANPPASIAIKYGYLLRGPDVYFDTGSNGDLYDPKIPTMLRIILSSTDIGAEIKDCVNLSCATGALKNGIYIDYVDAKGTPPDLPYQMRLSEGNDNNSVEKVDALKLSSAAPDHLAGKLHIDFADIWKADADFDLRLFKTFKTQYQLSN